MRDITDRLDAVGNVTKANTKGYSVGSASLACFLLFSAYLDEVEMMTGREFKVIDIAVPEIYVGGLLGSMTVFVFSAWSIAAVGVAAAVATPERLKSLTFFVPNFSYFVQQEEAAAYVAAFESQVQKADVQIISDFGSSFKR